MPRQALYYACLGEPFDGIEAARIGMINFAVPAASLRAETVKLAWKPNLTVDMDEKNAGTLLKLIDALDDDDDVQTVWGNYDISDEVMEKLDS